MGGKREWERKRGCWMGEEEGKEKERKRKKIKIYNRNYN